MKKVLSIILVLCLLVGIIPMTASADEVLGESTLPDGLTIAEYFPDPVTAKAIASRLMRTPQSTVTFAELEKLDHISIYGDFTTLEGLGLLKNVTSLSIGNSKTSLSMEDTEELSKLINVRSLFLSSIPNMKEVPLSILSLPNLTTLNLYDCGLQDIPPEIDNLQKLEYLHIGKNNITSLPPEIGNITTLYGLSIKEPLDGFPEFICEMSFLSSLNLGNADASISPIPSEISQLNNLSSLELQGADIDDHSFPSSMSTMTSLYNLSIYSEGITEIPAFIFDLNSMQALNIVGGKVTHIPDEISALTELLGLSIIQNKLTSISPIILSLPSLNTLFVSENMLTEELDPSIFDLRMLDLCEQSAELDDLKVNSSADITWDKLTPPLLHQLKRENSSHPNLLTGKWTITNFSDNSKQIVNCGDGTEITADLFPTEGEYEVVYQSSGDYDLNGHMVNNLEYKIHVIFDTSGSEEWPAWTEPSGAHDAYPAGAKVSHNGKNWINIYGDGNVWEPGVYGWQEQQ